MRHSLKAPCEDMPLPPHECAGPLIRTWLSARSRDAGTDSHEFARISICYEVARTRPILLKYFSLTLWKKTAANSRLHGGGECGTWVAEHTPVLAVVGARVGA